MLLFLSVSEIWNVLQHSQANKPEVIQILCVCLSATIPLLCVSMCVSISMMNVCVFYVCAYICCVYNLTPPRPFTKFQLLDFDLILRLHELSLVDWDSLLKCIIVLTYTCSEI